MLSEVAEIRACRWKFNRNSRLETNLSQFPITETAETMHHSPAKPGAVSTSHLSEIDIATYTLPNTEVPNFYYQSA